MSDMASKAAKVAVETSGSERVSILNIVPQLTLSLGKLFFADPSVPFSQHPPQRRQ